MTHPLADEARAMLEGVSPGEWFIATASHPGGMEVCAKGHGLIAVVGNLHTAKHDPEIVKANARFIAWARNNLAAMADMIDALQAQVRDVALTELAIADAGERVDATEKLTALIEWLEADPDNIHHLDPDAVASLRAALSPVDALVKADRSRKPPKMHGDEPFTQQQLSDRMDRMCGCSGRWDCDCVSVWNKARAELWEEANATPAPVATDRVEALVKAAEDVLPIYRFQTGQSDTPAGNRTWEPYLRLEDVRAILRAIEQQGEQ